MGCLGVTHRLSRTIPKAGSTVAKSLVITEKPSVARDIVSALGGFRDHDGYWESDDYVLTFSVGTLIAMMACSGILGGVAVAAGRRVQAYRYLLATAATFSLVTGGYWLLA